MLYRCEVINKESVREKSIRHGHPSTLHLWWSRKPLATCRGVLFASLVDDPGAYLEGEAAEKERRRLFALIEDLVKWENINNEEVINKARLEIAKSVARQKGMELPDGMEPGDVNAFLAEHAPPGNGPFRRGRQHPPGSPAAGIKGLRRRFKPCGGVVIQPLFSTDPPYYDNIGYADLADFFYVWLRQNLKDTYPGLFRTMLTPKNEELVATPYRFGGSKDKAKEHFERGLQKTFQQMCQMANPSYPVTVYYAFKQAENGRSTADKENGDQMMASTGWETMLNGLVTSGFQITGTWPMRTELSNRPVASGTNALASSIVLVCRPRPANAPVTTRRELLSALKKHLPKALKSLQKSNIAPVDLAQAAIGPGMAVFSSYSKVLEADGSPMTVRTALALVNQVLDEYLAEQEGEYDADTRWALAWFEQYGMKEGPFGDAETLSKAKNTSVNGLVLAGILNARGGKVKLLSRYEYPEDWDPAADNRPTVWEAVQHMIIALEKSGEEAAARLLKKLGPMAEAARDLSYRLFNICERKGWAGEALAYNGLVVAWPRLLELAAQMPGELEQR